MKTAEELRMLLDKIDHRGYPAYKETKGAYDFRTYILEIVHVQGDPFASPSRISIRVSGRKAGFPETLYQGKNRRIALQDYLLRQFGRQLEGFSFQAKGSGKSGLMSVSRPGQEILERSACQIEEKTGDITVRLEIGFPANGRTVNAGELRKILFDFLPRCVEKSLYAKALQAEKLQENADLADDQAYIREEMKKQGLVVFVANGAILPRESGISDRPMKGAVPFVSPESLEVTMRLPHKGAIKGMGIKKGITLIAGGGYHGKSTLLRAIERGVYNHIALDGREYVLTEETAMKVRAEDGRSIKKVDISLFIRNLPNGKDTKAFSTEDASGSTSQAAGVVEAMEAGTGLLLMDEDTCATNFMIRDELMQRVVHRDKEPIIPFLDRVQELYEKQGLSTILVAGSFGAYFSKADCIIQMDNYRPVDITAFAKKEAANFPGTGTHGPAYEQPSFARRMQSNPILRDGDRIKLKTLGRDSLLLQKEAIDLRYVEQLVDTEQLNALGYFLKYAEQHLFDGKKTLVEAVDALCCLVSEKGFLAVCDGAGLPVNFAMPRRQEVFACINRYRGLRI